MVRDLVVYLRNKVWTMNDIVEKTEGTAGEIVLYQPDEMIKIEVKLDVEHDTVWLNTMQMSQLFNR